MLVIIHQEDGVLWNTSENILWKVINYHEITGPMSFFTSKRERRLWIVSAVMVTTIYATIGLAQAFFELLGNQNVNAILF
ncbi:MAG: hypothetical protein KJO23_06695, partial [Bacteroidia bacterium]|nr:hypothetical protein [Bacteroidia bacterium]NNM23781.1 hypothetical protein [Flavobacteriaceae bacterium]